MPGVRITDVQMNGRGLRIPAAVTLRECSVVIIGSRCKICGRDFKCESDVALHTRWRHNAGLLMDILDHEMNIGQKCDVCDMPFRIISDLRLHKRVIHKHRPRHRRKRRREMVRVKFKLNGVTTTDVTLDRRYIKFHNSLGYIVDVCTQTSDYFKNEGPERKDDCGGNIDLSFPNHVADKSHMQCGIQPDKAANRYIVGKFASTKGDTIASRTLVVGKSLAGKEVSNMSHKNAIPDSNSWCEGYKNHCYLASQEATADVFIRTLADDVDIRDKQNSPRTNVRERKNLHCQNEISFDDNKILLACQLEKSDKMSNKSPHYSIRWSDEVAGTKENAGLANSFINSMEIIINNNNNEKSYDFEEATKRLSPSLPRLDKKIESMKANSSIDDDVQEVLRITRGNTQNDINHESPNRMEREMLVQNVRTDTLSPQLESTIYPEKCEVAFTNFESSNYPSFMAVTESDYQLLTNSFNKKLSIYLEDHYGIRLYNDLPEINNNFEEYAIYAHQDLFETWKQSGELPYTSELKANDNEVAILD